MECEMKIYCSGCQLYLGEIVKANIRKNSIHLCNVCESKRYKNYKETKTQKSANADLPDDFCDLFGFKK
jgi:hypothetical protein